MKLKMIFADPPEVIEEEHKGKSCYLIKFDGGRLHLHEKPEIQGMYAAEYYDTAAHMMSRSDAIQKIKDYYQIPDGANFKESKDAPGKTWVRFIWTWFVLEVN